MRATPPHWYPKDQRPKATARLLWPLAGLWRLGAGIRSWSTTAYRPQTPCVVIGNITAGGSGKTPLVAMLAKTLIEQGLKPIILTRGYGGTITGPHLVTAKDTARQIGDEAMWMHQFAPVLVSAKRGDGAQWIDQNRPDIDVILMDDGMQNPSITPHLKIAVFNGALGVGNGMIIPSGPLRERITAMRSCDMAVISGPDITGITAKVNAANPDLPITHITRQLREADITAIKDKPVLAFAGIGDPDQFFDMLSTAGVTVADTAIFPDHHPYSAKDIDTLKTMAARHGAVLVTTEKDMMRIDPQHGITAIGLDVDMPSSLMDMITAAIV